MQNAGIQGTRSTNWNSAEPGSKYHQRSSVSANAPMETASDSQRITPLRVPSRFGIRSSRIAPTSGISHERVKSGVKSQTPNPKIQNPRKNIPSSLGLGAWDSGFGISSTP